MSADFDAAGLRNILAAHGARYPRMEPRDAVKLVYQNEFGGGHLISDPAENRERLRTEWSATPRDPAAPLLEDLGDGMARVNLAALREEELEGLERDFLSSARRHTGDRERFLAKLDLLRELAGEGALPFSRAALEDFLKDYVNSGCPALSHSESYRAAYRPAYRVVERRPGPGQPPLFGR